MAEDNSYFDLQVNGYAGIDFNSDQLTAQQVDTACRKLRQDNVGGFLATIITADLDAMCRRIRAVVEYRAASPLAEKLIAGIHVEGPFISARDGFVGTHPPAAICQASTDAAKSLIDAGDGLVRLVTLAPEQDPQFTVTRWLADQDIRVSAGHCDPSTEQLRGAIDNGLSMFTHLGNGCPLLMHRHDNIIQRVLNLSDQLWICFIADGVHVPFPALRNYLQVTGLEKAIVVTDAISAAGMGPGKFSLGTIDVVVDDHLATWSADRSHLMGSAITMPQAAENLQQHLGFTAEETRSLTCENPRLALGL